MNFFRRVLKTISVLVSVESTRESKNFSERKSGRFCFPRHPGALEICSFRAKFFIRRKTSQNVHRGYLLDIMKLQSTQFLNLIKIYLDYCLIFAWLINIILNCDHMHKCLMVIRLIPVAAYIAFDVYQTYLRWADGVSYAAHIGGAIAG